MRVRPAVLKGKKFYINTIVFYIILAIVCTITFIAQICTNKYIIFPPTLILIILVSIMNGISFYSTLKRIDWENWEKIRKKY